MPDSTPNPMPTPTPDQSPNHASLIDLLTSADPRPLSVDERTALLAALAELAAAQSTIATQAMLLASYDEDIAAIERSARLEIDHAAAPPGGSIDFDPAEANAARRALLEATRRASSLGTIAAAALTFALRLARVP